jgi:hypothetical protein
MKVSLLSVPLAASFLVWANAPLQSENKQSESRTDNTSELERRSFVIIRTS